MTMTYLTRTTRTLLCTAGLLASALLSACGGGDAGRDAILGVDAATLTSLAVTPATSNLPLGARQQLVATANYSDGTSVDVSAKSVWTSASPAVASVASASGLATGLSAGSAVLGATYGGKSGSASVTVTAATLQALTLSPATASIASGVTLQYTATGTYTDGSTRDLTGVAGFTSASTAVASITASGGLATAASAGTSVITTTDGGLSASATLTVTAATLSGITLTPATATLAIGATRQLTVTASYSDGSTANVTAASSFVSATPAIASVTTSGGLSTGNAAGTAIVSATYNGQGASSTLTVSTTSAALSLGAANSFAVLSASSITNNAGGTTVVIGDIGAPSQTVAPVQPAGSGYANYTSGQTLADALAALQVAITDANSRPCSVSVVGNADLSSAVFSVNATLPPGVYCVSGAITIGANLTLDGSGFYLFRAGSTLNSTANVAVSLTNGAAANNIFWVPVGATTLGANGAFQGSILGQSAAITVGDNTTLQNGRVLSGGAVTLQNNPIAIP